MVTRLYLERWLRYSPSGSPVVCIYVYPLSLTHHQAGPNSLYHPSPLAPPNLWTVMNRLRTLWPLLVTTVCCSAIRVVREGGRKRRRKRRRRWLFARKPLSEGNPTIEKNYTIREKHTHNINKARESQSSHLYPFKLAVASFHPLLPRRR